MFALDTNSVVYLFKGAGRVGDHLLAVAPSEVAIPAVVLYELEVGALGSNQAVRRRNQLDTLLTSIVVLPFDDTAARRSAELDVALRKAGSGIGPMDTLIAGTALAHGATLVTRNVREFRRVKGLSVIDWY